MKDSVIAELMLLRKRPSTWVLLGIWVILGELFLYIFPYISYLDNSGSFRAEPLTDMLPSHLVAGWISGFPFYGGAIVLILGALTFGSEYGWNTLKTVFTQRPGRLRILAAKLIAVGLFLLLFVGASLLANAISAEAIALREGAASSWPSAWDFVRGFAIGWFILAVWTGLGLLLGVVTRGVALAIGIGIIYALVIEGLLGAFADTISWLHPLAKILVRANAYSLVKPLGALSGGGGASGGPGAYSGPFVSDLQAFLVLAAYLVVFLAVSALLLRQRDVT